MFITHISFSIKLETLFLMMTLNHINKVYYNKVFTFTDYIVLSMGYDEELIAKGELRKACSKRGNAYPPSRRVNTTGR